MYQFYIILIILNLVLLFVLLLSLPLPAKFTKTVLSILDKFFSIMRIGFVILAIYLIFAALEMKHHEEKRDYDHKENFEMYLDMTNKRFRAERNFYIIAFTVSMLLVLMRLQVIMKNNLDLNDKLKQLEGKKQ